MTGSAGAVSSKWKVACSEARNTGTGLKPLTNDPTSIAATVPLGNEVDAMMGTSNCGPTVIFNVVACDIAAMMTAFLPAP